MNIAVLKGQDVLAVFGSQAEANAYAEAVHGPQGRDPHHPGRWFGGTADKWVWTQPTHDPVTSQGGGGDLYPCPCCTGGSDCQVCGGTGVVGIGVALTCPDCGADKDVHGSWCDDCYRARYVTPRGRRAFFYTGQRATIDQIHGEGWSKTVTAKAVARAAKQEKYRVAYATR